MKRVLLTFCLVLPLLSQAQKHHRYTFNFNNPDSLKRFNIEFLNPDYNGAEISLKDSIFNTPDGFVSLSIEGENYLDMGGALQTGWPLDTLWRDDDVNHLDTANISVIYDHYLFILRGSKLNIKGNGAELDSLIFSEDSYVGNLKLISPLGVGIVDSRKENWFFNNQTGVSGLVYQCNGQLPKIRAITVSYRSPLDILEPIKVIPSDSAKVTSFQQFEMTFTKKVRITDNAKVYLKGPNGLNEELILTSKNDSTIVASLRDGVEEINVVSDDYKIVINKASIITKDNDGYFNKELTYHFSIIPNYATFELVSIEPSEDVIEILKDSIKLTFTDVVSNTISNERIYITDKNNKRVRTAYLKKSTQNPKVVYVCFGEDNTLPIPSTLIGEKIGYYTLTIPEGYINNFLYNDLAEDKGRSDGAQFNPEIIKTYNVGNAVYPDPTLLHIADSLLKISGVGYPAKDSESRVALTDLVKSVDEGVVTDDSLNTAIDAFYAETNIEQPQNAKFYIVSAVSSKGNELYFRYSDGAITLTNDSIEATHFLAQINDDKTISLITPDGKYIQQLMQDVNNVSSDYDAIKNSLSFEQFHLEGKSAVDCFGLWSINCWVATAEGNKNLSAYARVDFSTSEFSTSVLFPSLQFFEDNMSNAFRMKETDSPIPDAKYSFDPESGTEVENLYKIILAFNNIDEVNAVEDIKQKITLVSTNTMRYSPTKVSLVEGKKNQFQLYFDDVKAGSYTLIIPKGSFTWTYDGREAIVQEITASYVVKSGIDFSYDFLNKHNVYLYRIPNIDTKVRDIDLNDILTLVIYEDSIFGVSDKVVRIINLNDYETYAQGHLILDENFVDPNRSPYRAFQLVLDKPIKAGELPVGTYQFDIPEATFGDSNFAKWLKDPQSVSKTQCHVNAFWNPFVSVDNDMANLLFTPKNLVSTVETLSEITVTFPYHQIVTIPNQEMNVIDVFERYTGRFFTTSFVPVEGTTNQFRFDSTERLTADTSNGGYHITVPKGLFKSGNELMPTYGDVDLYYYAVKLPDAIDEVSVAPQSDIIFDLSGRRVKDISKSGVYIINGKKVVVK